MRGLRPACLAVVAALTASACSLQPIDLAAEKPLPLRSTIVASDGSVLARLYRQNRALVSIDDIPENLVNAVIAAEDQRFFEHGGFDLRAIARAALVNAREGTVTQGGSTITQQYVKNVYFRDPSKTFLRKAKELRLAIEVERRYSKREILERYLNTVYFGDGAYGIKAAAETFFGHGASKISLPEASLLAAVIKAPAIYNPREHPRRAMGRRNYVLTRMQVLGLIPATLARTAKDAPLGVLGDPPQITTRRPYFVEAVKREILLDRRLGRTDNDRARVLYRGGLRVETTLVPELQTAAERAVRSVLNQPGDPEAALVAIDPTTGEIVAMVGGSDWSASQVNLALGRAGGGSGRQPGSSFKPIVAATALEAGISLDTRYEASPAIFTFPNADPWTVRNSEGTAGGFLPLDEALVRSVNGVYARLGLQLGPAQIATQAELMGVGTELPSGNPSIALGSEEVSVLDMATAYATLANDGTSIEPTTIKRVRLASGEILRPDQRIVESAMSPGNAYLLTKVLEQVIQRGTGTGANIGRPAAGKTGTSNDYADAWFVGYTPHYVAAVWVGYPQGRVPMTSVRGVRVAGGTFPATIWRNFMLAAHEGLPIRGFELPRSELITVEIDPVTGLLAASWCPGKERTMLRQLAPTEVCPVPPPPPVVTPTPTPSPTSTSKDKEDRKEDDEKEPSPDPKPSPTGSPEGTPEPKPTPTKS